MQILKYAFYLTVLFGALALSYIALHYFDFDLTKDFLFVKNDMLSNPIWLGTFYLHLLFGAIATLSGFPLFFSRIIPFRSKIHKCLGKLYIVSILIISGPTGLYLAFFAEGGELASIGFVLMALAWILPTYIAFQKIIIGQIEAHKKWIFRSYAMTLSGVTLRLYTPIGADYFDYETNFIISAFLPWIFNLGIAELIIQLNRTEFNQLKITS